MEHQRSSIRPGFWRYNIFKVLKTLVDMQKGAVFFQKWRVKIPYGCDFFRSQLKTLVSKPVSTVIFCVEPDSGIKRGIRSIPIVKIVGFSFFFPLVFIGFWNISAFLDPLSITLRPQIFTSGRLQIPRLTPELGSTQKITVETGFETNFFNCLLKKSHTHTGF